MKSRPILSTLLVPPVYIQESAVHGFLAHFVHLPHKVEPSYCRVNTCIFVHVS